MKKILSINSTLNKLSLIIQNNNSIVDIYEIETDKQSEIFISSIEEILEKNKLSYDDIDIFSAVVGPGSFTGIKAGLSVLKGIQISTNKKIITINLFEIISFKEKNFDLVILNISSMKYHIKDKDNYYVIFKKDFIIPKDKTILTNDIEIKGDNILHSNFSNEKIVNLINFKMENNFFTENIEPLYMEEASFTKRKN